MRFINFADNKIRSKKMKRNFKKTLAALLSAVLLVSAPLSVHAENSRQIGDVNNDGDITSLDALTVLGYKVNRVKLSEEDLIYADYDGNESVDTLDALYILYAVVGNEKRLVLEDQITLNCGDRTDLDVKILPESLSANVTVKYTLDNAKSTDGTGEPVLMLTNKGEIKAHHPGTSVVTVTTSNGLSAKCTVTVVNQTTQQNISVGDNTLSVTKKLMTRNDCYNTEDDYDIQGIVVHSTASPGVMASDWYSSWNLSYEKGETDREVCVHAFLDDEGVYQYLPYEQVGWHVGGSANFTHIGFEICEPYGFYYSNNIICGYNTASQQNYFNKIWKNATVYCAYLCNEYNLDVDNVISHKEANALGLGTAHGDPDHWFALHGKTMDDFRNDVKFLLKNSSNISISTPKAVSGMQSSSAIFERETQAYDMFDVWGDNSYSLRY